MTRLLFFLFCLLLLPSCSKSTATFDPDKAHYDNGAFISIIDKSLFDWLAMRWREKKWPKIDPEAVKVISKKVDRELIASSAERPRATWIGHATVLVQYHGINFLTDPHLTQRPFALNFLVKKRYTEPALTFEQMPKIDFIVISHNHYDHLDHRTVDMFGNSVIWYVPQGLKSWFVNRNINPENVIELNWWQTHKFNDKVSVTFTPSQHWSKRTPWDTNKSLWGSWAVDIDGFKSWFAGDTGYNRSMFQKIGKKLGPFRFAMIPIGAYAPRYFMASSHIDPKQAVKIHQDVQSEQSLGIHWGTFQLTQEPVLEPPQLLKQALKEKLIPSSKFLTTKIGDTLIFN